MCMPNHRSAAFGFALMLATAVAMSLIALPGCGKEETEKKQDVKQPTAPAGPALPSPTEPAPLAEADDADDPAFKRLFPASDKQTGWIKTEPVKGTKGSELRLYLPALASVLEPYQPVRVASATYQRPSDGQLQTMRAYLVEAPSTDDAYGMLTASAAGPDDDEIVDVSRIGDNGRLYAVRGRYFAVFAGEKVGTKDLQAFAAKTTFGLPGRGGPAELVKTFQGDKIPSGEVFFLRDLSSLSGPAGGKLLTDIGLRNPEIMSQLLGMGANVDFVLAAYKVKNWPSPNVIWVARYPSSEQARGVYKKYQELLRSASTESKLHNNTVLQEPKGRHLLGCWTAEADSLAGFLSSDIYERIRR